MAGANLGVAYVTITPEMSGSVSKIIQMLGGVGTEGTKVGSKFGSSFSQTATKAMSAFTVAAGSLVATGISTACSTISASLSSAVSRYDTLNNFPKVMQNLGISSSEAQAAINKMSDGLTGLPTTLDAGASAVQRFTSVNNNVGKSTDYFLALNNAILAGGQSTMIQETALEQLSQAYSKGKMDMVEWRSLQTAMPAQLNQIAQAMGMTTDELGEGLRGGTVAMDDFMQTIVKLNDEGVGDFASFSEQAKSSVGGLGTAVTVLQTQVVKGVTSTIQGIDNMLTNSGLQTIAGTISSVAEKIKQAGVDIGNNLGQINLTDFIARLKEVNAEPIEKLKVAFDNLKVKFDEMMTVAGPFVQDLIATFSPIVIKVQELIAKIITLAVGLATRIMQAIQPILPVIQEVITAILDALNGFMDYTSTLDPVAQALFLVATAVALVAAKHKFLKLASMAKNWNVYKKAVSKLSTCFSAIKSKLATVIPSLNKTNTAVQKSSKSMSKGATNVLKYAAAVALLGAGVALIGTGFALMAQSCIALSAAGAPAMVMMAGMLVTVVALVAVMGVFAPALTAGSAGMLALGASILMVCTGLTAVIVALGVFAPQLNSIINTVGNQVQAVVTTVANAVVAIVTAVGNQIVAFISTIGGVITGTINAVVSGIVAIISTIASSISLIIQSVATAILTVIQGVADAISTIVTGVGDAISNVVLSTGEAINLACSGIEGVVRGIGDAVSSIFSSIFTGISDVINSIFSGIETCGWAIETIANKAWDASAGMAAFTGTCTACSAVLGGCAGNLGTLGSSMEKCSGNATTMAFNLQTLTSSLSATCSAIAISANAFNGFASNIESAMSRAASIVNSKMNEIRNAVNNAHLQATVTVSVGKLPHFRMNGKFDAESGSVPTVSVDWYKSGGVFTSPSIIGVGEAGNEAVLPLNSRTYGEIAEGISGQQNNASLIAWLSANLGTIINQNAPQTVIDNDAGSLIVDNRLQQLQRKAGMNRGYYTGVLSTTS